MLSTLSAEASPAVALIEDLYINRKLGLAFSKPPGWHFGEIKQMGLVKSGQLLDLNDLDLATEIFEASGLPIATVTQVPLSAESGSFTPGINVYLEHFSTNDDVWADIENDPLVACEWDANVWPRVLKKFSLLSAPTAARFQIARRVSIRLRSCSSTSDSKSLLQ